jgi:putative flippase GtrA
MTGGFLAGLYAPQHGPGPNPKRALLWCVVDVLVRALDSTTSGRTKALLVQLIVFAGVGGVFNVVYVLLYVMLREAFTAQEANAVALVLSTIAGTWGHRRITFGVRGRARTVPHQALGLALLAFGLAVTAGSLMLLELSVAEPSRLAELVVLAGANLGVGLVRFTAFRLTMVPHRPRPAQPS